MSSSNKRKVSVGNRLPIVAVEAAVNLAPVIADKLVDVVDRAVIATKKHVVVPPICGREHKLTIDDAEKMLSDRGLIARPIKLHLQEAHVKYRNCFDSQVVDSDPKPKQKKEVGDTVTVWYITQEVIDESKRIFDEKQKHKFKVKQKKPIKHIYLKSNHKKS